MVGTRPTVAPAVSHAVRALASSSMVVRTRIVQLPHNLAGVVFHSCSMGAAAVQYPQHCTTVGEVTWSWEMWPGREAGKSGGGVAGDVADMVDAVRKTLPRGPAGYSVRLADDLHAGSFSTEVDSGIPAGSATGTV